jgi:hypothetical protein
MKGNSMKNILVTVMLTLAFAAGQVPSVNAAESSRDDALKAYNQHLANGRSVVVGEIGADGVAKLNAAIADYKPVNLDEMEVKSAVKVWFEPYDAHLKPTGTLVAPSEYKWSRNERYRIWFESAQPVVMTLSQFYPAGKKTVTISPDKKYPKTETIIPAGERFGFPILFSTDDDNADEHLILLLVRADAAPADLKVNVPANGQNPQNGVGLIIEEPKDDLQALLTEYRDTLVKKPEDTVETAATSKCFRPRRTVTTVPVSMERVMSLDDKAAKAAVDDAATIVVDAGKVIYLNIVLHKK